MRVLVTGATGLIGRATLPHFAALGVEAIGLARHPAPGCVVANLFDALRVREVLERFRPTHVLHLAWDVTPGRFLHGAENLDWVAATMMFARAAAAAGVGRFVGVGTCVEYDWSDDGASPRRETDPLAPDTLYAIAKDSTRRVLVPFCAGKDISFAWARPFHLFGADESSSRFVGALLAALRDGRCFICRHGHLVRDYIATTDAGAALARLVVSDLAGALNIASGTPIALAELAFLVAVAAGRPELLDIRHEPAPGQPRAMRADVTRLRQELVFTPMASVQARLAELAGQRARVTR
jgi:nucleoside-diphosphate-sugar epimerase